MADTALPLDDWFDDATILETEWRGSKLADWLFEERANDEDTGTDTQQYMPGVQKSETIVETRCNVDDRQSSEFAARMLDIVAPAGFERDGIAVPTVQCRLMAANVASALHRRHGAYPDRVAANVEEGVTLTYRSHFLSRRLVVEVYNTREVAALVSDKRSILWAEDLHGVDDPILDEMYKAYWFPGIPTPSQGPTKTGDTVRGDG